MKRFSVLSFLLCFMLAASAQSISVKSFKPLPMDMTASSIEGKRIDQNGQVAALIKIVTTQTGFSFEGGTLGIVDSKQEKGEVWVWVPRSSRKITIKHADLGVLRDYMFPETIEAERTYEMVLTTDEIETVVKKKVTQQYLTFKITPPNAILEVNDELWSVDAEGNASKYVDYGTYSYRVRASNYLTDAGRVTVDDPVNKKQVVVNLKPNFATITLTVNADAEIWVNDVKKGTRSWTGPLGKGTYKIECKQASHETIMISKEITVEMNGETIILPAPTPIFGSLNVECKPNSATIFLDGKEIGETPISINEVLVGQHEIKLTKKGYADYTETVTITQGERKQVQATLSNGREIQFNCNVPDAQLEIDGKAVGSATGSYQLTYGNHNLKATVSGYQDYTVTLNVTENSHRHSITMQTIPAPKGAVDGLFSVSPSKRVYFSQGNLQYQASTKTWRFAEHQYDVVGSSHSSISSSYSGWIDLFGWGTSGYDNKYPYMTSMDNSDYCYGDNDITGTHYDWGVHNAISNGGNKAGLWRTLTKDEWVYVFNKRSTASGIRYAKACVNNMNGMILLPDDWDSGYYSLNNINKGDASYSSNTIHAFQWATLEQHGAVFLPAAGLRYGTSVLNLGSGGGYWSVSYYDRSRACSLYFDGSGYRSLGYDSHFEGQSVRLVRSAQ